MGCAAKNFQMVSLASNWMVVFEQYARKILSTTCSGVSSSLHFVELTRGVSVAVRMIPDYEMGAIIGLSRSIVGGRRL
jgi:serine acetyltransferase